MGRLQRRHSAEVRRHPEAAARVAAEAEGGRAGGDDGGLAAAAAAARAAGIVGIDRPAVDGVVALEAHQQLGTVGLADDDGACLPQSGHRHVVDVGHERPQARGADGRDDAFGGEAVFDRHRHAVKRPERLSRGLPFVRCHRLGTGPFGDGLHDGVQVAIDGVDGR